MTLGTDSTLKQFGNGKTEIQLTKSDADFCMMIIEEDLEIRELDQEFINFIKSTQDVFDSAIDGIKDPDAFPAAVTSASSYYNVDNAVVYRQAFLPNGEWILYQNDPASDGYIEFADQDWAYSEGFLASHRAGMQLLVSDGYESERVIPIFSDDETTSSDFEGRSEYYYDQASTKTQGGNVDYGLRQYVSAVEFKAGPTTNPHAPRMRSKRATGVIRGVTPLMNQNNFSGIFTVTLSEEDVDLFPNVTNLADGDTVPIPILASYILNTHSL